MRIRPSRRSGSLSPAWRGFSASFLVLARGRALPFELGSGCGACVPHAVVLLTTLGRGAAVRAADADVGAARRAHQLRRRGDRGLPVEDDAVLSGADHDRRAGHGARLEQRGLDAETLETVAEVAHGL